MQLVDVDVADEAAFAAWCEPIVVSNELAWPDDASWQPVELRIVAHPSSESRVALAAVLGDRGETIGASAVMLPLLENVDSALVWQLVVHPDHRRRGVGRMLLARAEEIATAEGRSIVIGPSEVALAHPDVACDAFAPACGYEPANLTSRRAIDLPIDPALLDALERSEPSDDGYEIVTWRDGCPEAYVPGRLALAADISSDAPQGELELETERWTPERLRESEARTVEMQRTRYAAGAVHTASGELVGFTDIGVSTIESSTGYQFDTVVAKAHRGHGLGMRIKVANHRALALGSPATRRVFTWNADANAYMIAVNERMGFRRVARGTFWKRVLGESRIADSDRGQ